MDQPQNAENFSLRYEYCWYTYVHQTKLYIYIYIVIYCQLGQIKNYDLSNIGPYEILLRGAKPNTLKSSILLEKWFPHFYRDKTTEVRTPFFKGDLTALKLVWPSWSFIIPLPIIIQGKFWYTIVRVINVLHRLAILFCPGLIIFFKVITNDTLLATTTCGPMKI